MTTTDVVLCACGCGEPAKLNARGVPNKLADASHRKNLYDMGAFCSDGKAKAAAERGDIPFEKFREVVLRMKAERNMTWRQLEDLGGLPPQYLRRMMGDRKRKTVSLEWATRFFRRLQGLPTESTERERAQMALDRQAALEVEADNGIIDCPGSWSARDRGCTCTNCKRLMADYKREWRAKRRAPVVS